MSSIYSYLRGIEDFRIEKKCLHKLSDILFIGLVTYLSNREDCEDMVLFSTTHESFLREHIELKNGIPSHDTFNRVFSLLEPDILRQCLNDYGKDIIGLLAEKQICLDGKKLRGVSPGSRGNQGLYIVNAWVSENRLCIGQKKVEDKSSEITALPALIDEIDIEEAVVSIDAIGCQRAIAAQIKENQGHYLLSLKENQGGLYEDTVYGFKTNRPDSVSEEWEYAHGRYESRKCSILKAREVLLEEHLEQWAGIQTLVRIESLRQTNEMETNEIRYYISDETGLKANYFNEPVRGHWGIENHLDWHLDVTFREDDCRARKGYAAENIATLRKLALQIIQKQPDKLSLKKRRLKAAYDMCYLKRLLIT